MIAQALGARVVGGGFDKDFAPIIGPSAFLSEGVERPHAAVNADALNIDPHRRYARLGHGFFFLGLRDDLFCGSIMP